mgnify:CR=1 FL=1
MARNIKKEVQKHKEVAYTSKDFKSLRNDLRRYMLTHFSDSIVDFSDASLGGMFLDLGAYVGDVLTYYMDHQFNENNIETAVERDNLERLIKEAGVKIPAAAPAFADVNLEIVVPATIDNEGIFIPETSALPTIRKNSIFSTPSGTKFYLLEDVNFSERDSANNLLAQQKIGNTSGNAIINFILTRKGLVSSAKIKTETISIDDRIVPFRTITLTEDNVNEIVSVIDSLGDNYYEVDSLSQDTVFRSLDNASYDSSDVSSRLELLHAPKRFVATRSVNTGKTTLRFGSGNEDSFDEDIIPDPSEHAIRLFGDRKAFTSVSIDPNSFLNTQTLGISPRNTTLTINYRHGGGLGDNVSAGDINSIDTLITRFMTSTTASDEAAVRASLSVFNPRPASGGEDEPTLEELRNIAIFNRSAQNRIVTREDLIARVYSMPSQFGRVFRAAVSDNPRNPRGAELQIISRDASQKLKISSDTLKQNLAKYLNHFRLVSDAIDILDASIVNIGVNYAVTVEKGFRQETVINSINTKIKSYFDIKNFQINKPIIVGELENLILNVPGVVSKISLDIVNRKGVQQGNSYSNFSFNVRQNVDRGFIFPPKGGIFELKYPNEDINGRVV